LANSGEANVILTWLTAWLTGRLSQWFGQPQPFLSSTSSSGMQRRCLPTLVGLAVGLKWLLNETVCKVAVIANGENTFIRNDSWSRG
jgi:hypothetical protein